jgi:hypothetical protein
LLLYLKYLKYLKKSLSLSRKVSPSKAAKIPHVEEIIIVSFHIMTGAQ